MRSLTYTFIFLFFCTAVFSQNMFRTNNLNTGFTIESDIQEPELKWSFATGGSVRSTALISDGIVYIGSNDTKMYAIDFNTGEKVWDFETGGIVPCSPALLENQLLFSSRDGFLYALEKSSGEKLWDVQLDEEYGEKEAWEIFISSPTIYIGKIYIGTDSGKMICIDAENHSIDWTFQVDGSVVSTPAVDETSVYFGSMNGYFYCVDRITGEEKWNFDAESNTWSPLGEVQTSPVLYNDKVSFATRGEYLYSLDKASGELIWKFREVNSWFIASPSYHKGQIFIGDSDGKKFHSFDAETGELKHEINTHFNIFGSAAVTENSAYFSTGNHSVPTYNGNLYSMDIETGDINWKFRLTSRHWSSPVLKDGHICLGSDNGTVYMIVDKSITDIKEDQSSIPQNFELKQNYPNPFNPATMISYKLHVSSFVQLKIYDSLSREILTLVNKPQNAGQYNINFNANDLTTGVYYYTLKTNTGFNITKKMLLLK